MGLFDFDIHDNTPEKMTLTDISADKGNTWTTQHGGYVTRPHCSHRTIVFTPANSTEPVIMTIPIPSDRDAEEYIDEYLDGMLNEFLRYNSEWEFK